MRGVNSVQVSYLVDYHCYVRKSISDRLDMADEICKQSTQKMFLPSTPPGLKFFQILDFNNAYRILREMSSCDTHATVAVSVSEKLSSKSLANWCDVRRPRRLHSVQKRVHDKISSYHHVFFCRGQRIQLASRIKLVENHHGRQKAGIRLELIRDCGWGITA